MTPTMQPGTVEVEVTECLYRGMLKAAREQGRAGRGPKMWVARGMQTCSSPDLRAPDGLIDIALFFNVILEECVDLDPHAIIECKRVAGSDTRLCRKYVKEGIDRFASGKYGGCHTTGFMTGYLQSGSASQAAWGINRHLDRKNRQGERLGPCTAWRADWARSSRHPRPGGTIPVELHHAFLEFVR